MQVKRCGLRICFLEQRRGRALGQCSDWQGSRCWEFRQSSSAAMSCAVRFPDLSAESTIRMAVSSETLRSMSGDQKSTSSVTARSTLSSLVSASKLEAIEAVVPPSLRKGKFRPPDKLLALLKTKS